MDQKSKDSKRNGKMGHLVLTRYTNQSLMIGDDVKITILGVNNNQVRISIDAPQDVAIWREELYMKIQQKTGNK